jgi:PAS domain S-box-containing protein
MAVQRPVLPALIGVLLLGVTFTASRNARERSDSDSETSTAQSAPAPAKPKATAAKPEPSASKPKAAAAEHKGAAAKPEPARPAHQARARAEHRASAVRAILGLDGRFLELNPGFCVLVGYEERDFRSARWPSPLAAEDSRGAQQRLLRALAEGETERGRLESPYLHSEGLLVSVEGEVSLIRDANGEPEGLLLVCAPVATPVAAT